MFPQGRAGERWGGLQEGVSALHSQRDGGVGIRALGFRSRAGASYCCLPNCGGLVHTQAVLHNLVQLVMPEEITVCIDVQFYYYLN